MESKETKRAVKWKKKIKLEDKTMGNFGYVNSCLNSQIEKMSSSKEEHLNLATTIQEKLIDHLMKIYQDFWKDHIENIINTGIKESTLKVFNRRPAVT